MPLVSRISSPKRNSRQRQRVVAHAHREGLRVFAWPVDDEERFRHCLDCGVDGITSNDHRLLARLLGWT